MALNMISMPAAPCKTKPALYILCHAALLLELLVLAAPVPGYSLGTAFETGWISSHQQPRRLSCLHCHAGLIISAARLQELYEYEYENCKARH